MLAQFAKFFYVVGALGVISVTSHVFVFWTLPYNILVLAFSLFMAFGLVAGGARQVQHSSVVVLAVSAAVAYAIIFLPFREFNASFVRIIFVIILLQFIFAREQYIQLTLDWIHKIIFLVSLSSILVILLIILGVPVPFIELTQDFRRSPNEVYFLYPGSIYLSSQSWGIGPATLLRSSGIFREPGHFAIFGALSVLAGDLTNKRALMNNVIVAAGMLTFSPAFYIFMGIRIVFRHKETIQDYIKRLVIIPIMFSASILMIYLIMPESLQERQFGRYLEVFADGGLDGLLEARSRADFSMLYGSLSFGERFLGIGPLGIEGRGFYEAQSSDVFGFILRYGYISLFSLLLFGGVACRVVARSDVGLMLLLLALVILVHRSWMFSDIWLPAIISMISLKSFYLRQEAKRLSVSLGSVAQIG